MTCPCTKSKSPATGASYYKLTLVVRSDGDPLACGRCLDKHIAKALVYVAESREDEAREAERALAAANISCAREHAEALADGRAAALAEMERAPEPPAPAALASLLGVHTDCVGRLCVAEDALRFAGRDAEADAVREIRIKLQSEDKQQ